MSHTNWTVGIDVAGIVVVESAQATNFFTSQRIPSAATASGPFEVNRCMVLAAREVGCGQTALDVALYTVCVFLYSCLCIFIFYSCFFLLFLFFHLHTPCCWLPRLVAVVGLVGGLGSYSFSKHAQYVSCTL